MVIVARLEALGADLKEAGLTLMRASRASDGTELTLTFDGYSLAFEITGTCYVVPASGHWPGVCRMGKRAIRLFAETRDPDVSLVVMESGHLHINNIVVDCSWSNTTSEITVGINPTMLELLRIAANHSAEELAASGLMDLVLQADAERQVLISRAANTLALFGDCHDQIAAWVDHRIRGGHEPWRGSPGES